MCGICGFISVQSGQEGTVLDGMVDALSHRGPDDRGTSHRESSTRLVSFGHTRLSVLDVSPAGHQPMHLDGYSIVFNGEIYNFREIRAELESKGYSFRTQTDTEVVVQSYVEWGPSCVSRFLGMFAIAIFDPVQEKVLFFLDRAGVKPLVYSMASGVFMFGSELKALMAHPMFEKDIEPGAVSMYMAYGYIPAPHTIFKNCYKMEPGTWMSYDLATGTLTKDRYWSPEEYYQLPELEISYSEATEQLNELLLSASRYRMVSDVPVGVFLSGGYDSSAVTALLQTGMTDRLKTFTIGFEEGNNEAPFARAIAERLGTDHHEYTCTTKEAQDIIPDLSYFFDEPFGDPSAIPTILVSRFARTTVTVALSADAGDELFAGYVNHASYARYLELLNRIPRWLETPAKGIARGASRMIPNQQISHRLSMVERGLSTVPSRRSMEVLKQIATLGSASGLLLKGSGRGEFPQVYDMNFMEVRDPIALALLVDYKTYLPNDILTKVDRSTMSVSLEGREPLLDHRILEFAARLPSSYKMAETQKKILKDVVHRYLPKEMMDRPKTGFSVPLASWLRSDLSSLLQDHLSHPSLKATGFFRPEPVLAMVRSLLRGRDANALPLWRVLQFQMWYERWMGKT